MALLNTTLEISSGEALQMWEGGIKMPPEARRHPVAYSRIRRSGNGLWVIRLHDLSLEPPPLDTLYTAEQTCFIALKEFVRLQGCGIDVISRGCTALTIEPKVFAVNPWIDGMIPCEKDVFAAEVRPLLGKYFTKSGLEPILPPEEVARAEQYSTAPTISAKPFYHDTDTRLYV